MSTIIQRDKQPKGSGKAPAFQIRITPELKEQMNEAASRAGMSLGNWLKELARKELRKQGIEPKA
ncbi:TPA: toxin-antitoxin system HicB family antitoxin [Klebsiella quasipneumoniae]|nr:toxin-antitoxin system HicB family antitoxin [Klebsiella quasipneumoniae]